MNEASQAACEDDPIPVFSCFDPADVGAISDQVARELTRQGAGSMFYLVGIGGRVKPIMEKTISASKILAIDGCPMDCVAETLRYAGFQQFEHCRITDLGLEKRKTEVSADHIDDIVTKSRELLAATSDS